MKPMIFFLFAAIALAQEPAQPSQPAACPEPQPGSEVTITISWDDITVPIEMPAASNETLNRFVAHHCAKYSKDITGKITGKEGADVSENLRTINLILETYQTLVDNITAANPKLFGPADVRAAKEASDVKEAELETVRKEHVKNSLVVNLSKEVKPEVRK